MGSHRFSSSGMVLLLAWTACTDMREPTRSSQPPALPRPRPSSLSGYRSARECLRVKRFPRHRSRMIRPNTDQRFPRQPMK